MHIKILSNLWYALFICFEKRVIIYSDYTKVKIRWRTYG